MPANKHKYNFFAFVLEHEVLGCHVPVGIIDDGAASETTLYGTTSNQLHLFWSLRIELQNSSRTWQRGKISYRAPRFSTEYNVWKKHVRRLLSIGGKNDIIHGNLILLVGIAEPLDGGNADRAIEDALSEGHALAHITKHDVTRDTVLQMDSNSRGTYLVGDVQHGGGNIAAYPVMSLLCDGVSTQTGATTNIEEKAALIWRKIQ